jgi:hypothetical protein
MALAELMEEDGGGGRMGGRRQQRPRLSLPAQILKKTKVGGHTVVYIVYRTERP